MKQLRERGVNWKHGFNRKEVIMQETKVDPPQIKFPTMRLRGVEEQIV